MSNEREMTLDEWCGKLHDGHLVNLELKSLRAELDALRNPWSPADEPPESGKIGERVPMTPEQQKMVEHIAVQVMGWPRKENGGQPFYEHSEFSLDVTWVEDFNPFEDSRQCLNALLVLRKQGWNIHFLSGEEWLDGTTGDVVRLSHAEYGGVTAACREDHAIDLHAICTAICAATGYRGK